jgi:hypothetical protein
LVRSIWKITVIVALLLSMTTWKPASEGRFVLYM